MKKIDISLSVVGKVTIRQVGTPLLIKSGMIQFEEWGCILHQNKSMQMACGKIKDKLDNLGWGRRAYQDIREEQIKAINRFLAWNSI